MITYLSGVRRDACPGHSVFWLLYWAFRGACLNYRIAWDVWQESSGTWRSWYPFPCCLCPCTSNICIRNSPFVREQWMFWGTRPRRCSLCISLLCEVFAQRGPWSCRMCSSCAYISGIQFCCTAGLRIGLLLSSCLLQRSIDSIAHFIDLLVACRSRFLCTWASARFCWVHCACRRGGISGTPGRLAIHIH